MPTTLLATRALVLVEGTDAQSFLQAIVTTDVDALEADEVRAGALLSPQGKILFDFLVSRDGDGLRLDARADVSAALAKRLALYRLRANAEIRVDEATPVTAVWQDDAQGLRDTRFPPELNVRRRYGASVMGADDPTLWDALRVENGVAESGTDYALGDAFPHDVLLDQNGGLSFQKGCYVGQEVVSRMQHRGTARRRVMVAESPTAMPAPGAEIAVEGRAVGTLGTVAGAQALALVRVDRVADALAARLPVLAGEASLTFKVPPGASFALPTPGAAEG